MMSNILSAISFAANHFFTCAQLLTIVLLVTQVVRKKFNLVRFGVNYIFLFYMLCVISLVFFPLPTMTGDVSQSVGLQAIPFHFVSDIIRETSFVWNQPKTYLMAICDRAVLQVVFNVIMTVPFGMYLRYDFHFDGKKVAVASFLLSSFIEIAQFTGLFFMFSSAYRLCDVDDLMANTLGGVMGYVVVRAVEKRIPAVADIERFDITRKAGKILINA
ncbi:MAG: VanZ family protein [Lachnospiraceae bacterium]|nr:VanZ family protein [Lachnospiraceae bacterium]